MMSKSVVMDWFVYGTTPTPPPTPDQLVTEDLTQNLTTEDGVNTLTPET